MQDWRSLPAGALEPVVHRAQERWRRELGWETGFSWAEVERARVGWGLPGLVAVDDHGQVRGLTFLHARGDRFDLGGLYGDHDEARRALLHAAVIVAEASGGAELSAFIHLEDPDLHAAFTAEGFAVEPCDYLMASGAALEIPGPVRGSVGRSWSPLDLEACAALLHVSYDDANAQRFVAEVSPQGWRQYLETLVTYPVCGRFLPEESRVVFDAEQMVGVVLVTELSEDTAHVAQVAVRSTWRRQGLAGRLLDAALEQVRQRGYAAVTLLVSTRNAAALALYRAKGFERAATFLVASRPLGVACGRGRAAV